MWKRNPDGTYTAEPDDTLWGLAEELTRSGSDWDKYEFSGDPTKAIDPKTLQIGDTINIENIVGFTSNDAAAKNITSKINPISKLMDLEHAGYTYTEGGNYHYTRPTTSGSPNSFEIKDLPDYYGTYGDYYLGSDTTDKSRKIEGIYHTHGSHTVGYKNEVFSSADKYLADVSGEPIYLGTPGDQFKRYDPDPNYPRSAEKGFTADLGGLKESLKEK